MVPREFHTGPTPRFGCVLLGARVQTPHSCDTLRVRSPRRGAGARGADACSTRHEDLLALVMFGVYGTCRCSSPATMPERLLALPHQSMNTPLPAS